MKVKLMVNALNVVRQLLTAKRHMGVIGLLCLVNVAAELSVTMPAK